jgi:hypothetical protein
LAFRGDVLGVDEAVVHRMYRHLMNWVGANRSANRSGVSSRQLDAFPSQTQGPIAVERSEGLLVKASLECEHAVFPSVQHAAASATEWHCLRMTPVRPSGVVLNHQRPSVSSSTCMFRKEGLSSMYWVWCFQVLAVWRGSKNAKWESGQSRGAQPWIQIGSASRRSHEGHATNPCTNLPEAIPLP